MFVQTLHVKEVEVEEAPHEDGLFEILKNVRTDIARKEKMPAYIVFSDATLLELATYLPLTLDDMRRISGFGEVKLARYGEAFLEPIVAYCEEQGLESKIDEKVVSRKTVAKKSKKRWKRYA
jgi:ATP-dependent DNA helicase RecQ